jgi:hypothetical protein
MIVSNTALLEHLTLLQMMGLLPAYALFGVAYVVGQVRSW